jgi:serine/threonine protein kinase
LSRQIAGVESPYVLPLHELVETGRHKFLVYDDPGGQTVAQHMATHGRLAAGAACSIAREAAQALAALHAAGVVHGRVRPQNIIMGQTGTEILIVDPLAATDSEEFEIAADYAAPELAAAGAQPTQLTDIYALGSTLYQMLTGDVPFAGGDATQKLSRHATERIKPLDQIAGASLPLANPLPLTNVVAYAMAKDTSLRYADARALAEALRPFTEQNSTPANSANRPTSAAFQQATADRRASFLSSKPTAAQPAPSGMPQMPNVVQAIPASQVSSPSVAPNTLQPNAARATNGSTLKVTRASRQSM